MPFLLKSFSADFNFFISENSKSRGSSGIAVSLLLLDRGALKLGYRSLPCGNENETGDPRGISSLIRLVGYTLVILSCDKLRDRSDFSLKGLSGRLVGDSIGGDIEFWEGERVGGDEEL
jgi:hypothetical protein